MGEFTIWHIIPIALVGFLVWLIWYRLRDHKKHPEKRRQMGGGVMLLIIGFTALGPLYGVGRLNGDLIKAEAQLPQLLSAPMWTTYKQYVWTVFLASCVWSFYAGWLLWKRRNPHSVKFAIGSLWVIGPLTTLVLSWLIPGLLFGNYSADEEFLAAIIPNLIISSLWTWYLLKSPRVKALYYRD